MNDHILLAYELDGNGGGIPIPKDEVAQRMDEERLTWVHLDANHPETRAWLEQEVSFHDPFIVHALLADETQPRMTQLQSGVLLMLRGVNLNENADPEDMVTVRMWIENHRIISLRRRKVKAVMDMEVKIKEGKGPKDLGQFVCMLAARLFERMQPVLAALDEKTDEIEEAVLAEEDVSLREAIVDVRIQAIMFRRYMAPQRDAIEQLMLADVTWLDDTHRRHLQESHNHVMRYVEDLDAIRERAQIVKDELANILSDRLNKNMYVLSVIAAIFLPLGFLTGLLGINVGGIPGADNGNAFMLFCGLLVLIVAIQVFIFKKLKWF